MASETYFSSGDVLCDTATVTRADDTELHRWLAAARALAAVAGSGQGLSDVLDLVADTARSLLAVDFCGVLVPDADGRNLIIAGSSGLTADYVARVNSDRPVRLEDGSRIGAPSSRAFRSGRPVAVADISREQGFIWGGVAAEQGYRSMVSVPLVAGPLVLGTLNSYHREVHDFTAAQIDRLTLLADHAAIALQSIRTLDDLRHQHELVTRSEQIHERLLRVALRAGGIDGIAAAVAELLGRAVLVEDGRGDVLARSGVFDSTPPDAARREVPRGPGDPLVRTYGQHVVVDVVSAGAVAARLWLPRGSEPLLPLDVRALEHASIVLGLELLRLRTATEVEQRLRGELLADLLRGADPRSRAVRERGELLGHDLSRPHAALVARVVPQPGVAEATTVQRALDAAVRAAAGRTPRPLVAAHDGAVVALWPLGHAEDAGLRGIGERLLRALSAVTGAATATVAVAAVGAETLARAHRTVRGALGVAERSGRAGTAVTLDDLGVAGLLLQLDDAGPLIAFADRTLGPVRRHDRDRGTALLHTLRTHLDTGLDRVETARRLTVHPNTVAQRLRRVEAVAGLDLARSATLVDVASALVLLDVAEG